MNMEKQKAHSDQALEKTSGRLRPRYSMVSESNRCSGCCESFIRFSSSIWFCAASGREPCSFKDMIDARHRESSARECQEHDIIYDRILAATSSLQRMAGSSGVVHPCGRHRNLRPARLYPVRELPSLEARGSGSSP